MEPTRTEVITVTITVTHHADEAPFTGADIEDALVAIGLDVTVYEETS